MASKKPTKNQQEYKRQMKRIRQALYRERKKGFDVREAAKILLEKPTRITQKFIEKLKEITPKVIRKQSKYIDYVPPKGTPIIEKPYTSEPNLSYTVSTDFGDMVETIDKYTGEVLDQQPVDWVAWDRAHDEYDRRERERQNRENATYYEEEIDTVFREQEQKAIEQTIEEPIPPATQDTTPYEEAVAYTKDYIQGTAKEFYTLYDEDGNVVGEIIRVDGNTFVDQTTGEVIGTRNDVNNIISDLQSYGKGSEAFISMGGFPDLTDYAIEELYNRTANINSNTGGVFHDMFDAVRERIGDEAFYDSLTATNGFQSAFEVFSKVTASGGSYPQEFVRFGAAITNSLPLSESERADIENAFAQIIEAEYGEFYD